MSRQYNRWWTLAVCWLLLFPFAAKAQQPDLEVVFRHPPAAAKPWVFWYWMQASVSREGITADLEAMKAAGIGGAYLMPIKGVTSPPLMEPPVEQLTPAWWEMVRYAMQEADRLGLQLAMHVSDGFALAGGPWITPELSMQQVVWSETQVAGGRYFNDTLPRPPAYKGYYRDIAVMAYPSLPGTGATPPPQISSSLPGVDVQPLLDPHNRKNFRSDTACWIQLAYEQPFTCRNIFIRSQGPNYQAQRLILQASDDGRSFRTIERLQPPRHGWQDYEAGVTHTITPTTARFFRLVYDTAGTEPGAEDLDAAKWKPVLKLCRLALSGEPRLHQFEGKTGAIWRVSPRTTAAQLPDSLCIPQNRVIDLTASLDTATGRLQWQAPPGNWTILRLGHTSTGHTNATGGAGTGLECDKFNPAAVRLQFDNWFGAAFRKTDPALAARVLKIFHVDSWECGSQNWSPVFREEFRRRRGYDLLVYLPAMAGIPVQSAAASERFLHDVRQTIAELVVDRFYGTLAELVAEKGCLFSAENVAPTMTSDGMAHFSAVDIPMGEFWFRSPTHDKPNDMLDAISGAHIYGKPLVQAEAFTTLRMGWDEHPGMLKALGDRHFALGVNRLVYHVFTHNPWMDRRPGMTLDGVGLYFQRDQTWWKPGRAWVAYAQRCQALLQLGQPVTDMAVFTGEEIPRRAVLPERLYAQLPGMRQYSYDSFNPDALLRLASVQNGRIVLPGGASYAALVLPGPRPMAPEARLSPEVMQRFRELANAGAKIVVSGSANDTALQSLPHVSLAALHLEPDVIVEEAPGIVWTHRRTADADIYFISSQEDTTRSFDLSLRIAGKVPELWDPLSGDIREAKDWRMEKGRTVLPLQLVPAGSLFIVLRKHTTQTAQHHGSNWPLFRPVQTLPGNWQVAFDPSAGGPAKPLSFAALEDWSRRPEPGIGYYAGTAVYTKTFDWKKRPAKDGHLWLDLGDVANIAEVRLNGMPCGIAWTPPYRVDITQALRPGRNHLRIEVTNTWANRLIGDQALPEAQRITRTTAPYRLEGKPLLRAGLLGPVTILNTDD
ncbi:glycosyl hydrolase [Chitinophaga japonensis]|uniref:Alpha-L-rhamnosidase-like protein n=1 Tax=Chitinophaga japonensis TaxID=104662 RepID=A0A562T5E2_CHIJA|nr:glycosyl hydrolase [Chitinophaga japonensis]TWI88286.1 alpha-L-rhamnosidase-like protein [Chitinophaga japonensis]